MSTPSKKEFARRLRTAMTKAGYEPKPAVLEREFNLRHWGKPMTLHGVRRWLRGETMPDADKIETLGTWLKIDPYQLQHGEIAGRQIREKQARWEVAIKQQERETFEAFLALPAPQKRIVREVIMAFAKAKG